MDTRTYILIHRIKQLYPRRNICDLKTKCFNIWTGASPGFCLNTKFFSCFKKEFGEFTHNGCEIDIVRNLVFSMLIPNLIDKHLYLWTQEHTL